MPFMTTKSVYSRLSAPFVFGLSQGEGLTIEAKFASAASV